VRVSEARGAVGAVALLSSVVLTGCGGLPPAPVSNCEVRVFNHFLPGILSEDTQTVDVTTPVANGQTVELSPPYVAEQGGQYGPDAPPEAHLAMLSIGGTGWGDAAVHFEHTLPRGETTSFNVLSDDFRQMDPLSRSFDELGVHRFNLRALDDTVDCRASFTIEVVPRRTPSATATD
jgi:hypothetical protein